MLTSEDPVSLFCTDGFLLGNIGSLHVHYNFFRGSRTIEWRGNFSANDIYDIEKNGFRVFHFKDGAVHTIADVWETLQLFLGALVGKHVPKFTAEDNVEFLEKWAGFKMEPRPINFVNVSKSLIRSGDFLGIIRLDGLDPLLALGMGSRTGQ